MKRTRFLPCVAILVVAVGLLTGCSRGPSEEELKQAQAVEQLTAIKQAYTILQQARADLAASQATLAELEAVAERQRTDEQTQQIEEFTTSIPEAEKGINTTYEELQTLLQDFLNFSLNEVPEAPETIEGLNIYADEAIVIALDIVDKSGHYSKAIDHLTTVETYYKTLGAETYQPLADKIAELDDWQFITRERFDLLKKKMTKDEVNATVGVVYVRNIQEDPKTGIVTWLYKTREGNAAAVYFDKKELVYQMKWEVLKTRVIE